MKRFLKCKFIVFLIMLLLLAPNVYAASNPYPKYQESPFGGKVISCTWYAWEQAHDRMGVDLPLWTYVQTWYNKAEKAGYSVGKTPKPNSIMIWNYGDGFGGHASYVTAVNGDTVTFDEGGGYTGEGINIGTQFTMSEMSSFLVGFIYLDVPRKVQEKPANNNSLTDNNTNKTNNSTNKNNTQTQKPVVKSSNNNLSNLTIEKIDFEFAKDKLEYTFEVENNVDKIKISATAEDNKSKVDGNNDYELKVGENNFTIKVTAEDSSVKEYKVNIIRKDEEKVIKEETIKDESKQDKKVDNTSKIRKIIFIGIGISILIILVSGLLIFKTKKHKK